MDGPSPTSLRRPQSTPAWNPYARILPRYSQRCAELCAAGTAGWRSPVASHGTSVRPRAPGHGESQPIRLQMVRSARCPTADDPSGNAAKSSVQANKRTTAKATSERFRPGFDPRRTAEQFPRVPETIQILPAFVTDFSPTNSRSQRTFVQQAATIAIDSARTATAAREVWAYSATNLNFEDADNERLSALTMRPQVDSAMERTQNICRVHMPLNPDTHMGILSHAPAGIRPGLCLYLMPIKIGCTQ